MNDNIAFSQVQLRHIRREAKKCGIELPKRLTALRSGIRGWFLVEGNGGFRKEVCADNAYDAKYKIITALVDAQLPSQERAEG